ncbi:Uncharacterised protein [Mycobacteroides abscessus subsp. abscessus]|nr:Uncharacterised protein [Mycobacteroides abscessus subsp. abscessus]
MHKGEITDQRHRATTSVRQCRTDRGGYGAVDAGYSPIGAHTNVLGTPRNKSGVAHRVGRAEHQLITGRASVVR